jgi:hypothetical protein
MSETSQSTSTQSTSTQSTSTQSSTAARDVVATAMRSIQRASMVLGTATVLVGLQGLRLASGNGDKVIKVGAPHELALNTMNVRGAVVFLIAGALIFASGFPRLGVLRLVSVGLHSVCAVLILVTLRKDQTNPLGAEGGTFAWHFGLGIAMLAIVLTLRAARIADRSTAAVVPPASV